MIKKNIATNEMGFVFNPATGDSYRANTTAASIIQLMKDGKNLQEIKKDLIEKYDTDKATVEKDVEEFLHTLNENNLLNH